MTFLDALKRFGPIAAMAAGKYGDLVIMGIGIAEESAKKGKDKKKIAIEATRLGAETVNAISKTDTVNVDKAVAVAEDTVDIVVQAVNKAKDLAEAETKPVVNLNPTSTMTTAKVK